MHQLVVYKTHCEVRDLDTELFHIMILDGFQDGGINISWQGGEYLTVCGCQDGILGRNHSPSDLVRNWYDGSGTVDDPSSILGIGLSDWVGLGVRVAEKRKGIGSRDANGEQHSKKM